jgi:protein-disulfide isomerase
VNLFRRSIVILMVCCMGCSAQSVSPDLTQKIERRVRAFYSIPASVKITVEPLKPSEFPNYDAVTIDMMGGEKKQTYDFLVSKDSKTLIRMTKMDLTKDPYAEVMSKISLTGRPTRGSKDAKVVLVNFDDFQCPFCSRMHQTLFPGLLKEYGDRVEFVYKDYPLAEIHPWAMHAAVDANCLAVQNNDAYWEFADYIHTNQSEVNSAKGRDAQFAALDRITTTQGQKHNVDLTKLQACIKAQDENTLKASISEADTLGVTATPTLFVNGQEMDGAIAISEMRAALDLALTQAGVQPPSHGTVSSPGKPEPPSI